MKIKGRYTVKAEGMPVVHFPFKGRDYHDAKAKAFAEMWRINQFDPNRQVTIFLTQTDAIYEWANKELTAK